MKNKVSIIVPVYNIESYVGDCINSLINQTYENLEILLINDGSKDRSLEICNYFSSLDNRIRIINKKNGGLSSARNCGLDNSRGDYILFVDGDDQLNKYTVEKLMKVCEENNHKIDFLQFKYKEIYNCEEINHENMQKDCEYTLENDKEKMFDYLYTTGGEAVSSCTKIYKKDLFKELRFKEGILHEDEYIITDIIDNSTMCAYLNQNLYYYIMREGSITHSNYSPRKKDIFFSIDKRIKYFEINRYESLLKKEVSKYFVNMVIMYAEAKKAKYYLDCQEIKNRMKVLLKKTDVIIMNNNMKLLYNLCKLNVLFLDVYCFLKIWGNSYETSKCCNQNKKSY